MYIAYMYAADNQLGTASQSDNRWTDLPVEIMEIIIGFLSSDDIQLGRLACKDWLEALSSAMRKLAPRTLEFIVGSNGIYFDQIFKNIRELDLSNCRSILTDEFLLCGLPHMTKLAKLDLGHCDNVTDESVKCIVALKNLKWLSLQHCIKVTDESILSICGCSLSYQPHASFLLQQKVVPLALEYLDISGCILLSDLSTKAISLSLVELRELRLGGYSRTQSVNDEMLQPLSICKSLNILDISGCIRVTEQGLSPILVNLDRLTHLNLWNCLSLQSSSLSSVTTARFSLDLLELSLRGCHGINDDVFTHIACLKRLERLDMRSCEHITGRGLVLLSNGRGAHCQNLHSLNMKGCFGLVDLRGIAPLKSLKHLNVSECWQLTQDSVQHLLPLENLVSLDLGGCRNLSNEALRGIHGLERMTKTLETLNLSNCEKLGPLALSSLSSHHALKTLDVSGCTNLPSTDLKFLKELRNLRRFKASHTHWSGCSALQWLGPDTIEELVLSGCSHLVGTSLSPLKKLKNLHCLILDGCSNVPLFDRGLCAITPSLNALAHISMQNCITIGDNGIASLGQLKNLEVANFSDCYGITGEGFKYWVGMTKIHTVILQGCSSLQDTGIFHLTCNNPSIRELNLKQCRRITDKSIIYVASFLPSIKSLMFQASMGISDLGIRTIARQLKHTLTHLSIQFCWQFGDESAIELATMPWLKHLDLLYSWKITDASVRSLASSTSLVSINIFGCHRISNSAKELIQDKLSPMCRN